MYYSRIRIATLAGWDSDNPAATWGGLLGFMIGRDGVEAAFGVPLSEQFDIHRTRRGFANQGEEKSPFNSEAKKRESLGECFSCGC